MRRNSLLIYILFVTSLSAFSQNGQSEKKLELLKYFALGDDVKKFIPYLTCMDQGSSRDPVTIDRIPSCKGFRFSIEKDSFLIDDIAFSNIILFRDSSNLVDGISIIKTYLQTQEDNPKKRAKKEFKELKEYFGNVFNATQVKYTGYKGRGESAVMFSRYGINYLVRLVEIKQKRPVAAILDVSISRP